MEGKAVQTLCNYLCRHQVPKSGLCLAHGEESLKVHALGPERVCARARIRVHEGRTGREGGHRGIPRFETELAWHCGRC